MTCEKKKTKKKPVKRRSRHEDSVVVVESDLDAHEYIMKTVRDAKDVKVWQLCDLREGTCFYDPADDSSDYEVEDVLYIVGSNDNLDGHSGIQCWDMYENEVIYLLADMEVVPVRTELRILR